MNTSGKMSTFGGPKDKGVSPTEGLALFEPEDLGKPVAEGLFLPEQPPGTGGLARRLNPEAFYLAMRWDYQATSRTLLRGSCVELKAHGKTILARPVDWGPHADTGRVADLSPGAAAALGLSTDDAVECVLIPGGATTAKPGQPGDPPPETKPNPPPPSGAGLMELPVMTIKESGWLAEAKDAPIRGGEPMTPQAVVIHFTSGATAQSSVEAMKERGLSAHVVIDRDGTILQCRSFKTQCAHAGRSQWVNPRTKQKYSSSVNPITIGIEIANAGNDDPQERDAYDWAAKQPGFASITARHRNGGEPCAWEAYPKAQLAAVFALTKALVERYRLDDVTGHDCIAPQRKNDPGPAFPMAELREFCGFGRILPAVRQS